MSKSASLTRIVIAYLAALVVAVVWLAVGPSTERLWLDTLVADLLATGVIFGFSRAYGNSSFYDAYWSVVPPLMVAYWWVESGTPATDPRAWLLMGVVVAWAVRLTGNWVVSWPGLHHEDWRYPMLREKSGRAELVVDLAAIHVFPTLQVFLATLPAYVVLTRGDRGLGWLDALALLLGLGAVWLEHAADQQMRAFVRERTPGQVMDRGLWGLSRHPNYLGELGFWTALAVAMLAMFLGASIPMMETRSLERRPAYQEVIDRVPMLVPRPWGGTRPRRTAG